MMTPIEIETLVAKAGRSMASLLRAADWDPQLWQRWKRGKASPTIAKYDALLAALAKACGE
jgi:hypothetical protein